MESNEILTTVPNAHPAGSDILDFGWEPATIGMPATCQMAGSREHVEAYGCGLRVGQGWRAKGIAPMGMRGHRSSPLGS